MAFSLEIWQEKIVAQMQNWKAKLYQASVYPVYSFLSSAAILPAIEALQKGGWMQLGALFNALGVNLLANQIQKWKDLADPGEDIQESIAHDTELRKDLDKVLEKLEVITLAGKALPPFDKERFSQTLREELHQLGNLEKFTVQLKNIHITGDLNQSLVVAGNNNSINFIIKQYGKPGGQAPDPDILPQQITEYLTWLRDRCCYIELRGVRRDGQQVVQLPLDEVYVPLEAEVFPQIDQDDFERSFMRKTADIKTKSEMKSIDLNQVLQIGKRIIITGGPGSGKTTVLIYIAWVLAQAIARNDLKFASQKLAIKDKLPLPIFIPLSLYARHLRSLPNSAPPVKKTLANFITHFLIEKQTCFNLPDDFFTQLLGNGQAVILLLDGLDEVPDDNERAIVRQAIEELVAGREKMLILLTCRTAAYKGRTALGKGFREVRVKPLTENNVAAMIEQAYTHIYRSDMQLRQQKIKELIDGIKSLETQRKERLGEEIEPLVTSPLMVRLLLIVHFSERKLPDHRAELFIKATDAMLLPEYSPDELVAAEIGRLVGGSRELHRDLAQHLAFAMHTRGAEKGREISEDEIKKILIEAPGDTALVNEFLAVTRLRGTLLEERLGMYRFIHLSFQEFLVARYLAEIKRSETGIEGIVRFLEADFIRDSWWREPVLLIAGYLSVTSPRIAHSFLLRMAQIDLEATDRPALPATIQLATTELAAAAFLEWQTGSLELKEKLIKQMGILFQNRVMMNQAAPLIRAQFGNTLAQIGDPRSEVTTLEEMKFCYIPPGRFWMGSSKADELSDDRERPEHQLDIRYPYWISRFPITNAQFDHFVKAKNGYRNDQWWTKPGLKWRGKRQAPDKYGGIFDLSNHPVVNICWYEALAFARWLTHEFHTAGIIPKDWYFHLPSEAEWEKAARGGIEILGSAVIQALKQNALTPVVKLIRNPSEKRRYPWGNDPDPNRANYSDTGIGSTSAGGCFPNGVSVYGAEEMSGNVWEWTRSLWGKDWQNPDFKYPYNSDDGRENLDATDAMARVVRGGAFVGNLWFVRCSFRFRDDPDDLYFGLGFRVVLSLFTADR